MNAAIFRVTETSPVFATLQPNTSKQIYLQLNDYYKSFSDKYAERVNLTLRLLKTKEFLTMCFTALQ